LDRKPDSKARSNRSVGELLGDGARVLPEKSHGWFRDWFRKVWKVRGGGLYALGFALSFVYFEVGSLGGDILGIGSLFNGHAVQFVVQFFVDSLQNTLKAFVWPVYVMQLAPPWGAIALGVTFVGFAKFLKAPIERWLFPDGAVDEADTK